MQCPHSKIFLDTLEGQILTALIVVTFVMIFLIREWVVQQQPDLALAGDAGNLADLDQAEDPAARGGNEEDQEEDQEEDGIINEDLLDAAFGEMPPPYEDEDPHPSDEEEQLVPEQQAAPASRLIAPLRRRRAFPPIEEVRQPSQNLGASTAFGGQGMVLGGGGSAAVPSSFQLDSSSHRRPQANREVMAQAAELRRQIEERLGPDYLAKLATSSATIPQMRGSMRKEIMDDDSDWEDEDDEGAENKHDTPHRSGRKMTPQDSPTLGRFKVRPAGGVGNVFEIDRKSNPEVVPGWSRKPEVKPTVVFGGSQGTRLFGNWESGHSTSAKPFQFNGADIPKSPLIETRIFSQLDSAPAWRDEESYRAQVPQMAATTSKGKGKASESDLPTPEITDAAFGDLKAFGSASDLLIEENAPKETTSPVEYETRDADDEEHSELPEYDMKWSWDEETPHPDDGSEHNGSYQGEGVEYGDEIEQPSYPIGSRLETEYGDELEQPLYPETEAEIPENDDIPVAEEAIEAARPLVRPAAARGNGWLDWLLGDIPQADRGNNANREPVLPLLNEPLDANREDDLDAEWDGPPQRNGNGNAQDNLDNADGAAPAVDIDEGDDFDGIMELVGMRGPIFGLMQNAAISLVLITLAVMLGIAVPYIWGRILLTVLAHPILFTVVIPWSLAVFCANLMIDTVIGVTCYTFVALGMGISSILSSGWAGIKEMPWDVSGANLMHTHADEALRRVVDKLTTLVSVLASDRVSLEGVSIMATHPETSRAWLASRQPWARATLAMSWFTEKLAASTNLTATASHSLQVAAQENRTISEVFYSAFEQLVEIWKQPSIRPHSNLKMVPNVSEAEEALVEFSNSSSWTAADRVLAVIAGYVLFTIVGAWYLAKHKSQPGSYRRHLEKTSIELLQQAGGVMKVILIIGIEMFVFPLYCGLLLGKIYIHAPARFVMLTLE